jgi:hypothetical protein
VVYEAKNRIKRHFSITNISTIDLFKGVPLRAVSLHASQSRTTSLQYVRSNAIKGPVMTDLGSSTAAMRNVEPLVSFFGGKVPGILESW